MSTSFLPVEAFSFNCLNAVTLYTAGVTAGSVAPYDNTKEIIVLNTDVANNIYVRFGDPAVITVAGDLTNLNSTIVPPGVGVTFAIGPAGERQHLGADVLAGLTHLTMFVVIAAGGPIIVNVTYVQCRGYTGPM